MARAAASADCVLQQQAVHTKIGQISFVLSSRAALKFNPYLPSPSYSSLVRRRTGNRSLAEGEGPAFVV